MCIAIMNPSNVTLKKKLLQTCWDNNYHGGGLLYINTDTNQLESFKSLKDFDALYSQYQYVRKKYSKSKVVLHFRISTHGTISEDNVHPFFVNQDIGFVHNGIISQAPHSDRYSDTYMFNKSMLQALPDDFVYNEGIMELLSEYIGYSKLLFLDIDNEYHIVNEDLGVWDHGCWFSNTGYKASKYLDYGGTKVLKTTASKPTSYAKPYMSAAATNFGGRAFVNAWDTYDDKEDVSEIKDMKRCTCEYCLSDSDNTYSGVQHSQKWDAYLCADCEWELENEEYEEGKDMILYNSPSSFNTNSPF
jgi:hypothetical protein